MAGFLKKLFSKEDNSPLIYDYNNITRDLESEENQVSTSLKKSTDGSREIISKAFTDIADISDNFQNLKVKSDADLNIRVKSVAEKSLPQFAAALKKTVPDVNGFPDDPQEYYNAVAETLKSVTKCIRGQGKYVIAAFPEEMNELKGHITIIGREINSMNETFRPALEKTALINAASSSYEKCRDIAERHSSLVSENLRLKKDVANCESEISKTEKSISELKESSEYKHYESAIADKISAEEGLVRIADSYHLITANLGNVFRKVSYAADKDGTKELVKNITHFEAVLNAKGKKNISEIEDIWSTLYSEIAGYIKDNPSFVKTKSEERLFLDKNTLISDISNLCESYAAEKKSVSELKQMIEGSDAAKQMTELSYRMTELKSTLERSKNTIASNVEAIADLEAEYEPACTGLNESLSKLKGKTVIVEAIPQLSSDY